MSHRIKALLKELNEGLLRDARQALKVHWRAEAMKRKNPWANKLRRWPLYGTLAAGHAAMGNYIGQEIASGNYKSGIVGLGAMAVTGAGSALLFKNHIKGATKVFRRIQDKKTDARV